MSTAPASAKARRKLATYGKATHNDGFDFDVPDSPEGSDNGNGSKAASRAPLLSTARSSKPTKLSRSPKRPSSQKQSTAAPAVAPMLSSFSDPPEDDPFDVPSSDNERSKAAASPFKPAIKRRKVPGKEDNGTLAAASEKAVERTPRREETRKKPHKETEPPPKMLTHLLKTQGPSKASWREGNKLSTSTETSDMEGATNRSRDAAATSRPGARPKSPLRKDQPRTASQPADRIRPVTSGNARLGPHHATQLLSASSLTRKSPKSEPKTPPPGQAVRRFLTPDGDAEPTGGNAFSYMSPSGLDFLGLDIAETPAQRPLPTSSGTSNSIGQRVASPVRTKLKDRLARRDGAFDQPPTSDPTATGQADFLSSDEEGVGSSASQRLVEIHNEDMMDTLPSSQVEAGSTSRVTYGGGPRHTYAASNRTLRKDENATEDDMFASLADVSETTGTTARRIRVDAQPKSTQDSARDSMDFDEGEDEQPNALRNIHELRQAGANAQLHGETEALLDEVESKNTSTTRSGLVSLLGKLDSTAFRDKFAAAGLDARIIARIDSQLDLLSSTLLSMALLQLLAAHSNSQTLLAYQRSGIVQLLKTLVTETDTLRSLARNRKSNVIKALQQEIDQVGQTFVKSSLWKFGSPTTLTPRIIALQLIEYLARYTRGTGLQEELLPAGIMDLVVGLLASHVEDATESDALELRVVLAILESATIGNGQDNLWKMTRWRSQLLETLSQLLASAPGWDAKENTETLTHLLRLGLNLTNNDIEACTVFARPDVLHSVTTGIEKHFVAISSESEIPTQAAVVDNLILSLGFLINLAEHSRPARELFSEGAGKSRRPLDILLHIFSTKWMKAFEVTSEQESRDSVPLGYLAVLLAFLCIENANRTHVASKLEGGSLKHLLIAVDAFLSYHRKVAEELQSSEEGAEIKAHFIERVQVVLNQLKRSEP